MRPAATRRAERLVVRGVVQGVGFRPFVHHLAGRLRLDGWVRNDAGDVVVEVTGAPAALAEFRRCLHQEAPPLARIDSVTTRAIPPAGPLGFSILPSTGSGADLLPGVPPDVAPCDACLAELFDPTDRRHRHPFISCTDCGPRYTIVTGLPYDRPATTMAGFPMCAECAREYHDPTDRRHHAQPICCPACGPTLRLHRPGRGRSDGEDALVAAIRLLTEGAVVAVKGLGGYHLAVDATDDTAVARLRAAKHRPDKPFAVMAADRSGIVRLGTPSPGELALMSDPARPVVLVPGRADRALSSLVAPGSHWVGLMLPSTPLHHLLLAGAGRPLVMTSANLSGEPILHHDDLEALTRLADAVLAHDRPIARPCDDSVVRHVAGRVLPLRRGRGHAPAVTPIGGEGRILAVGGELKNSAAIATAGRAWLGAHLGDLGATATLDAFDRGVADLHRLTGIGAPDVVAVDAHPGYVASRWARRHHAAAVVEVQHHHAHVAAAMAEHGLDPAEPVLGVAFDGTGYGDDGTIWGGEVLEVTATSHRRLAHLAPIPLPGGDAAIAHPARVALAHLHAAGLAWSPELPPVAALDTGTRQRLRRQLDAGVACVPTTSMGRLFDAVASLVGLRHEISYEAQAALDLEHAAGRATTARRYAFGVSGELADPGPVLAAITDDVATGVAPEEIASAFHHAVADLVVALVCAHRAHTAQPVVLTGGVFQNVRLVERCLDGLAARGIDALTHRLVPPNDGGLALGQVFVAAHRDHAPGEVDHVPGRAGSGRRPH